MFDKRYVFREGMAEFYWGFEHVFADENGMFSLDDIYTYCDEQDIDPDWFMEHVVEEYQKPVEEMLDEED